MRPADDMDIDDMTADQSADILDGGVDDITPVQLWDTIMKKYKVAQTCAEEIHRLQAVGRDDERSSLGESAAA